MTTALVDLEPKPVWKHFDALAAIPRPSTKEAAARNYVLALAARLGLEAVHDNVGNTVIRKPARPGREGAPMALLQGHLDMVCEKNEGTAHNFDTDAIKLVRDGRLAQRRRHHAGRGQRRRRGRRAGRHGEHRHRPRAAGVRVHHRRRDRSDGRGRVSRRNAEVQVFSEP